MAGVPKNLLDRIDNASPFHCPEVDGCSVADLLCSENRALHDVADMSPISYLLAIPPYLERILLHECLRNHCNHRVIFFASLPIHGEVAARSGCHVPVASVGAERHL